MTSCSSKVCKQAQPNYQSILTNYCQADFVVKMKFKSVKRRSLRGRKVKSTGVFKTWPSKEGDFRKLRKPRLQLEADHQCCSGWIRDLPKKQKFLVMGKKVDNSLVPTFIVPWSRDKEMKRARRMFKQIDCSTLKSGGAKTKSASPPQPPSTDQQATQFSHQQRKKSSRRNRRENKRDVNKQTNVNKQRHQQQKQRKRKQHNVATRH